MRSDPAEQPGGNHVRRGRQGRLEGAGQSAGQMLSSMGATVERGLATGMGLAKDLRMGSSLKGNLSRGVGSLGAIGAGLGGTLSEMDAAGWWHAAGLGGSSK